MSARVFPTQSHKRSSAVSVERPTLGRSVGGKVARPCRPEPLDEADAGGWARHGGPALARPRGLAAQIRAELVTARDTPDRCSMPASPHAERLALRITGMDPPVAAQDVGLINCGRPDLHGILPRWHPCR